jgi:hypothetical protein
MAYDKSKKHGVVNVSRASGTENSTDVYSVIVENGSVPIECDNGTIVNLGKYKVLSDQVGTENLEVYVATVNADAPTDNATLAIVASPELIYDECTHHALSEYYNEAGKVVRAYALTERSCFGLTAECFSNPDDLAVNRYVTLGTEGKLTVDTTEPSDAPVFGFIESVLEYDFETYYTVRIY